MILRTSWSRNSSNSADEMPIAAKDATKAPTLAPAKRLMFFNIPTSSRTFESLLVYQITICLQHSCFYNNLLHYFGCIQGVSTKETLSNSSYLCLVVL